jgi:NAD(P)-dependent dehydrogenase (short-subunit alcohol dehydrogenase family)
MAFSLDAFRLDGKVAIVTGVGAENSIGAAYARGLVAAGASVVVADRNTAGAQGVAAELTGKGAKVIAATVDISETASVLAMVAATVSAFGGVDILVNNAAMMVDAAFDPMHQYDLSTWEHLVSVNVNGALRCAQAVVPHMKARGGGKIVNQVSGGAYPATGAYGITKLALVGLTTSLATELGPLNINVNAIAPGATQSDAGKMLTADGTPFIEHLKATVPLRAKGSPDELVGPLLLLVSDAGSWITGQVIHVDGGWIMRP